MENMDENIINSTPDVETVSANEILEATPGYEKKTTTSQIPKDTSVPGEGKATAALILGVVSTIGGFSSAISIALGIVGLVMCSKAKEDGYNGGLRTAGFAFSLIGLILGILSTLLVCATILGVGGLSMTMFQALANMS